MSGQLAMKTHILVTAKAFRKPQNSSYKNTRPFNKDHKLK